jgi:hypothetical protein
VLVISVRTQISPNQNLPQGRHRFFRIGATVTSDHFPIIFRCGSAIPKRAEPKTNVESTTQTTTGPFPACCVRNGIETLPDDACHDRTSAPSWNSLPEYGVS